MIGTLWCRKSTGSNGITLGMCVVPKESHDCSFIVTLSAIDKMFEIFGPISEQNVTINFEPIFEQNASVADEVIISLT